MTREGVCQWFQQGAEGTVLLEIMVFKWDLDQVLHLTLVPVCPRSYYISWIWAIVQGNLSSPECNNDCPVTLKCHLKIAQDQPTNTVKQSQTVQIKLASKSNQENPPFYPYHCLQRFVAFDSSLEDYQIWKCELFLTSLASRAGCYLSVFILFYFGLLCFCLHELPLLL